MLLVGSVVDWTWLRIESELADIGMENFKTEREKRATKTEQNIQELGQL